MASGTSEPLAIYRRPGRYIVKTWDGGLGCWSLLGPDYTRESAQTQADTHTPELWAILGSEYTRETAHALADSLTQELKERRPARSQHGRAE